MEGVSEISLELAVTHVRVHQRVIRSKNSQAIDGIAGHNRVRQVNRPKTTRLTDDDPRSTEAVTEIGLGGDDTDRRSQNGHRLRADLQVVPTIIHRGHVVHIEIDGTTCPTHLNPCGRIVVRTNQIHGRGQLLAGFTQLNPRTIPIGNHIVHVDVQVGTVRNQFHAKRLWLRRIGVHTDVRHGKVETWSCRVDLDSATGVLSETERIQAISGPDVDVTNNSHT